MSFSIDQEGSLKINHIEDYKKFNETIAEIRDSIQTRILLYFVVKTHSDRMDHEIITCF